MPNINQNNETESINKEINLLQDRLEIKEKSLNQFKNRLMQIRGIEVQKTNLSKAKKNVSKYRRIYLKIRLSISKKADLLKHALVNVKKERDYLKKD